MNKLGFKFKRGNGNGNGKKTVKVYGKSIYCPYCNAKIKLLQHKGHGAFYARKWRYLNLQHTKFLKLWIDSDLKFESIDKNELYKELLKGMKHLKLSAFAKRVPFNGRVSELISAGTNYNSDLVEKKPRNNKKGPFYKLRIQRVKHVLRHGGILT